MYKIKTNEDKEIMELSLIEKMIDWVCLRFLWFAAGAFFGYLWMAKAYKLF